MPSRQPGPKNADKRALDISGISPKYPQRAFDLVRRFNYEPYRWQREELAVVCDPSDRPSLAYIQVPRKDGKSALDSMTALCEMCLLESRHIYAVSDSQNNLSSVFWLELLDAIRRSGNDDCFLIYQTRIEYPETGSFIQLRPGNFAASQGINPHLVLADEVHLIGREVWNGYAMSLAAHEDALLMGTSTPGYDLDSIAHDLYLLGKAGDDPDLYAKIYEPSNPKCEVTDEVAWAEANPAIDENKALRAALRRNCRLMPENDFRRFHLGQWTATQKAWLPYGAFRSRAIETPIEDGDTVWLAVDGSWSGDTTGVVACNENAILQAIGHWKPPVLDGTTWRVPIAQVEQCIREACARYDVVEILFDPARWSRTMQALQDEGLPVVEFPQSTQRLIPATSLFYDAVLDGRLAWVDDVLGRAMEAHISAAELKETDNGGMIRKPAFAPAAANIDLAVCALMAHSRAALAREYADLELEWVSIRGNE